jgi:hypothetical protein
MWLWFYALGRVILVRGNSSFVLDQPFGSSQRLFCGVVTARALLSPPMLFSSWSKETRGRWRCCHRLVGARKFGGSGGSVVLCYCIGILKTLTLLFEAGPIWLWLLALSRVVLIQGNSGAVLALWCS